jgi:hypothetical protein
MAITLTFDNVIAVPGKNSIIDVIDRTTGKTAINGNTLEEVQQREPGAVLMSWTDWSAIQIQRQQTAIGWRRISAEEYDERLNVLPPLAWTSKGFLLCEPYDHCYQTGQPRYHAFLRRGGGGPYPADHYTSTRPITLVEWRAVK